MCQSNSSATRLELSGIVAKYPVAKELKSDIGDRFQQQPQATGFDWRASPLTYSRHEFGDTIRDAEDWRKNKEVGTKTGVYSLQVLLEAAKIVVKQKTRNTVCIFP
jgi:hypothetical protein